MTDHSSETRFREQKPLSKAHDLIRYWPTNPVPRDQAERLHDGLWDAWERIPLQDGVPVNEAIFGKDADPYQRYFGCSPDQVATGEAIQQALVEGRAANPPVSQKTCYALLKAGMAHQGTQREQVQEQIAQQQKEAKKIQYEIDKKMKQLQEVGESLGKLSGERTALPQSSETRSEVLILERAIEATEHEYQASIKYIEALTLKQDERHLAIRQLEETAELSHHFLQVYRAWLQDLPDLLSLRAEDVNQTLGELAQIQELLCQNTRRFGVAVSEPLQKRLADAKGMAERILSEEVFAESIPHLLALTKLFEEAEEELVQQETRVAEQEEARKEYLKMREIEKDKSLIECINSDTDNKSREQIIQDHEAHQRRAQEYEAMPLAKRRTLIDEYEAKNEALQQEFATVSESGERLDLFLQGPALSQARDVVLLNEDMLEFLQTCQKYLQFWQTYEEPKHPNKPLLVEAAILKSNHVHEAHRSLRQACQEAKNYLSNERQHILELADYEQERIEQGFRVPNLYDERNNPYGLFHQETGCLHFSREDDLRRAFFPIWQAFKKAARLAESSTRSQLQEARYLIGPDELENAWENFSAVHAKLEEEFRAYRTWVTDHYDALLECPEEPSASASSSPAFVMACSPLQEQFLAKTEKLREIAEDCKNYADQVQAATHFIGKIQPEKEISPEITKFCTSSSDHLSFRERIGIFFGKISDADQKIQAALTSTAPVKEKQEQLLIVVSDYLRSFSDYEQLINKLWTYVPVPGQPGSYRPDIVFSWTTR